MKGIGWDDLGRGTDNLAAETQFYTQLTNALHSTYQIHFRVTDNRDEFYQTVLSGEVDFVTIDLIDHARGGAVGGDIARRVRSRMLIERNDRDFPIFLLSSVPESFKADDAYELNVCPVAKNLDSAALVAQQIAFRLKDVGRFGMARKVAIFARHAERTLGGSQLGYDALEALRAIVAEANFIGEEVSPDRFSLDILEEVRRQIQEASRIVVLLTRDEPVQVDPAAQLGTRPSHVSRPNVYVELGLVLGVRGGNRKLILIQEEGAYLPSDVGSHQPFVFRGDLNSIKEQVIKALKFRP